MSIARTRPSPSSAAAVSALATIDERDFHDNIQSGVKWLQSNQWDQSEGLACEQDWFGGAGYGNSGRPDMSNTSFMADALYDAVTTFVRELHPHVGHGDRGVNRLTLQTMQMEVGSSPRALGPTRFDGVWNVTVQCPAHEGASGYTLRFPAQVKDAVLAGQFGAPGQPSSLTLSGKIGPDGNVSIDARGMTPSELQTTIAQKLDKDWVHNPSVSVEVSTSRPFYVVGEVQKPGSYPYVTDMSVLNAIATAGGQTYRANMSDFYIKRKQDGRVVRVDALAKRVPRGSVNEQTIVLAMGFGQGDEVLGDR